MKNNSCWADYKWVVIQSHIVMLEILLDVSNYATKNKLEYVIGINKFDIAAKKLLLWKRKSIS